MKFNALLTIMFCVILMSCQTEKPKEKDDKIVISEHYRH